MVELRREELVGRLQAEMQLPLGIDADAGGIDGEVEDMAARLVVVAEEVQVVAGDGDALRVVRRMKADDRAGSVGERDDLLRGGGVDEARIRLRLLRHRPCEERTEVSVDAQCVEQVVARSEPADDVLALLARQRSLLGLIDVRPKIRHRGKRRELVARHTSHAPVVAKAEVLAVDRDHFAVEGVERAHTEIAMPHHVPVRDVAVIEPLDQRHHGRRLVHLVGLMPAVTDAVRQQATGEAEDVIGRHGLLSLVPVRSS